MKVLHCINSLKIFGGAEKIVDELRTNLENFSCFELFSRSTELTILYRFYSVIKGVLFILRSSSKFEVFHFHLFPMFYLSVFVNKNKVVIHEHNTTNRRRNIKLLRPIEIFIYRRAKIIVCISEATKASLISSYGPLNNIVVIPNFTRFPFLPNATDQKNEVVDILMVASFSDQKKHDLLIHALSCLPAYFRVHFAGEGKKMVDIKALVNELSLNDKVVFHGNVDDISTLYRSCRFAVLLSNWEGFGMVVVEAASFGKVTICTDVPGLSDVVNNEELLVDKNISPEKLAEKLIYIENKLSRDKNFFLDYSHDLSHLYSFADYKDKLFILYKSIC
jgi:glycosyltransferase involved in cell wall biosynthesis